MPLPEIIGVIELVAICGGVLGFALWDSRGDDEGEEMDAEILDMVERRMGVRYSSRSTAELPAPNDRIAA